MYPNQQQPNQPPQNDTEQWFTSMLESEAQAQPSKKSNKGKFIVAITLLFVLIGGVSLAFLLPKQNNAQTATALKCLDNDDFKALTGTETTDQLDAKLGFYTELIEFNAEETMLSDEAAADETIAQIAQFYAAKDDATSANIELTSSYSGDTDYELAEARLTAIKKLLTQAGVSEEVITTSDPVKMSSEFDGEFAADSSVQLTILSNSQCTQ